jgi:hypothetical protein
MIIQKGNRATVCGAIISKLVACTQLPLDTQAHHHQHRRHTMRRQRAAQRPVPPPPPRPPPPPTHAPTHVHKPKHAHALLVAAGSGNREGTEGTSQPAVFVGGKSRGDIRTFLNRICFVPCACKPLRCPWTGQKLPNAAARPGFESRLSNFLPLFLFGESQLFSLVS